MSSSVGTSQRNSTSNHNTNRSVKQALSKSQGRSTTAFQTEGNKTSLIRKKSEKDVSMKKDKGSSQSKKQSSEKTS